MEGAKSVLELLNSDFETECVFATDEFLSANDILNKKQVGEIVRTKASLLSTLGEFKTNNTALAIAKMKSIKPVTIDRNEFIVVLDDIRDPGNLGTIIRICDWYGIQKIIASPETAEFYNPKVLHASMGSFTRVALFYTELAPFLSKTKLPVFGTFLSGENIHGLDWGTEGFIVIGNEARGVSREVEKYVSKKISIPKFGEAESLNAAIATAVICDNIKRNPD